MKRRAEVTETDDDDRATMRDPFAAIPRVAAGVEAREDSRACLQIRKSVPPKAGVAAFIARRLGLRRHVRVNLDELGTLYWKLIDGSRNLRDIQQRIAESKALGKRESERSTLLFTKMLMMRYLIELDVTDDHALG